jgi:hypothetical protein
MNVCRPLSNKANDYQGAGLECLRCYCLFPTATDLIAHNCWLVFRRRRHLTHQPFLSLRLNTQPQFSLKTTLKE